MQSIDYENKRIFKKSYQKKHQYEKRIYDNAQNELKSLGISSWKKYDKEKVKLEELKNYIKEHKKALREMVPAKVHLLKKITLLKKKQKDIMKDGHVVAKVVNKAKIVTKKANVTMER